MDRKIKILFLAANPVDSLRLRLDEEIRAIDEALLKARFRDRFDIEQHWAVRATDLQACLLRHEPDVVHFSGHGTASSAIILEDNVGKSHPISVHVLGKLFSVLKDNVQCVVLNACYSEQQAQAIAEHIDYVIGMSKAIGDLAAIRFAAAFYQALGYGKDIRAAFDLACLQIDLENLDEQDTPKLITVQSSPTVLIQADAQTDDQASSRETQHSYPALKMARRALSVLEEQAAGYTALDIPVSLKIALEEKRREVSDLEARVGHGQE